MTPNLIQKLRWARIAGWPLLVMLVAASAGIWGRLPGNEDGLSTAVTLDLTVTASLLYWWLIRNTNIPRITVSRVFVAGLLVAGLVLRQRPHSLLTGMRAWLLPVIECLLVILVVTRVKRIRKNRPSLNWPDADFPLLCRMLLKELTGSEKIAGLLAGEMAVLYYVFFHGVAFRLRQMRNRKKIYALHGVIAPYVFTNYRNSGMLPVCWLLLGLFPVELIGFHLLLAHWSPRAAWIFTGLGIYTALQLYAHICAIRARPVLLGKDFLRVRNGLAADVRISLNNIASMTHLNERADPGGTGASGEKKPSGETGPFGEKSALQRNRIVKLALFRKLEKYNMIIRLHEPVAIHLFFGMMIKADTLAFYVDKPAELLTMLNNKPSGR